MRLPRLTSLMLAIVISWTSIGQAIADEPNSAPPAAVKEASPAEIEVLIRQLGDRDTAQRDAAARRLIEIGPPAKEQLETACENDQELDLIRRKAKVLLLSINRREQSNRWQEFLNGKSADGPPGWKKFRQVVDDTPEARKLYVDMFRAEPKLLETYATDPVKAAALVEPLCVARKTTAGVTDADPEVPFDSLIAYLLVAGDRKANHSDQATKGLANMMGFDFNSLLFRMANMKAPFILTLKDDSNKALIKKVVGRWICNTKFEGMLASTILFFIIDLDIKEGLPIALDLLKLLKEFEALESHGDRRIQANIIKLSIYAIGMLGDAENIKELEPLLKNSKVLSEAQQEGKSVEVQVRDMALVALVHLTRQKIKDYDIENVGENLSVASLFSFAPCYFVSEKQRQQAFTKWQKWRKQHPAPTPELIYIVSDQPAERGSGDVGIACDSVLVRRDCQ